MQQQNKSLVCESMCDEGFTLSFALVPHREAHHSVVGESSARHQRMGYQC
jgi:hypothetical protein